MNDLMEMLLKRRSIRKYTGEPIPEEALEQVLLAGLLPMLATGASALTLEEKQRALVLTAFAYYDKGFPVQYDSTGLSVVGKSKHGPLRITYETAPEYATNGRSFPAASNTSVPSCLL